MGQFLASPLVRHIVGQREAAVDLQEMMDNGGIVIANLAAGKIGEDNAALLGSLLFANFHLAALSRSSLPEAERRDFHLLVDEFQHFATDAFSSTLAESRKFGLALTLSHQFLGQLPPSVCEAVFGNIGTLLSFRVGHLDAVRLEKELAPAFTASDLLQLPHFAFAARITRQNAHLPSLVRAPRPPYSMSDTSSLIDQSRRKWGTPRAAVEIEIADRWEGRVD